MIHYRVSTICPIEPIYIKQSSIEMAPWHLSEDIDIVCIKDILTFTINLSENLY